METIIGIFAVLVIKLTAIVVGYKIVALGHDTLVKGLKGDFQFSGSAGKETQVKLTSASPGLLFVLLGSLLVGWALFVNKPIEYDRETSVPQPASAKIQPEAMKEGK